MQVTVYQIELKIFFFSPAGANTLLPHKSISYLLWIYALIKSQTIFKDYTQYNYKLV